MIFGMMLFPREQDQREREIWLAAFAAKSYQDMLLRKAPPELLEGFHGWLPLLAEAPQAPETVFEQGIKRENRAALAGVMLLFLLRAAEHHPRHCFVERAKAWVSFQYHQREAPSGKTVSASESLLEKAWSAFRPSLHLWAAYGYRGETGHLDLDQDKTWFHLIGHGEALRRMAEKARVVKPGVLLEAPDDERIPRYEFGLLPLPGHVLDWLEHYFPS